MAGNGGCWRALATGVVSLLVVGGLTIVPATAAVLRAPAPANLAISNSASTTVGASEPFTWRLKVTNEGNGVSSGYVIRDTVPAQVTDVTTHSPGCKAVKHAVTCSEGKLLVGHSATYTISGISPPPGFACFTDRAEVTGKEADPDAANNTSAVKTCWVPGWRLAALPGPTAARGWLEGVDCPSATLCVAVGGSVASGGQASTLVERRSGSSFLVQASPDPRGATLAVLSSVSCSSASSCVAVGDYEAGFTTKALAEIWNGKAWTLDYPLSRPGATTSELNGVSCTSSRSCVAVGQYRSGAVNGPLLERWNGKSWARITYHLPPGSTFAAVSCASASTCMAVGNVNAVTQAALLSAGVWTVRALPLPSGTTYSSLEGVSCPTSRTCVATGFYDNGSADAFSLTESWNGTNWTLQPAPNPAGSTFTDLVAVSCTSSSACTAVGQWSNAVGEEHTLAERFGTSWALETTRNPVTDLDELNAVGCSAADSCTGVGLYAIPKQETTITGEPADFYATLAEHWSGGSTWSSEGSADPLGPGTSYVVSSSCASSSFCMAVSLISSAGGQAGAYERWNGSAWSLGSLPNALNFSPAAVSCSAPVDCVAIGENPTTLAPAARIWSGSSWKTLSSPPGSDVNWYGLDCLSSTFCMAVGSGLDVDDPVPLAEIWNGKAWTLDSSLSLPAGGGTFPALTGVSCTTQTSCVAVGSYVDESSGDEEALTEILDGSTWTPVSVPEPAGSAAASLTGVACTTAGSCVAVGAAGASGITEKVWATQLSSGTWSALPLAVPAGADSSLTSVSCATASTCTVVGSVGGTIGDEGPEAPGHTLAERWNGKAFVIQPTPNLAGDEADSFVSVDCVSTSECIGTGIGWYPDEVVGYGAVWE